MLLIVGTSCALDLGKSDKGNKAFKIDLVGGAKGSLLPRLENDAVRSGVKLGSGVKRTYRITISTSND